MGVPHTAAAATATATARKQKATADRKRSWVMLAEGDGGGYTPLPGEQTLYQSPPRTTLSLHSSARRSAQETYSQTCKSGVVYLTNRRLIYLPVTPTPALQSFAVPILNVADSRVTAPWFGANKWEALIAPVAGGGIPPAHAELDLVMEFKEGGAFDFASIFERLKERLRQAVDVAREADGADAVVDVGNVHLEDLPAYEDTGRHARVPEEEPPAAAVQSEASIVAPQPQSPQLAQQSPRSDAGAFEPPLEPPPGYEEVQRSSIADELERRVRSEEAR